MFNKTTSSLQNKKDIPDGVTVLSDIDFVRTEKRNVFVHFTEYIMPKTPPLQSLSILKQKKRRKKTTRYFNIYL